VYQAGTLSGNPLAMTAGIETLGVLREPGVWDELERTGAHLEAGLRRSAVTSTSLVPARCSASSSRMPR
jgi:glutamate-1-semialdehyde 2,1-aminomutase